jgi:hypothetical protein
MEEDKPNEDSDVEKEIDDDGDRPLREISKRSTLMKDRTMSMDSEASVYTQNSMSSVAPLSSPATKISSRPAPLNLTQQPSPLLHTSWGISIRFVVVCCRKRVRISCFVEIIVDGVHTCSWRRCAKEQPISGQCVACIYLCLVRLPPNFASAMRMKIEGGVISEGSNPDIEDEEKSSDMTHDSSGLGSPYRCRG